MMKTTTRFRFGGTSPTYGTFSGASGGASHSRALSSAVLFLLSILMLIPVSARAEGEDSGSGTDEVTFTYISANPAGYNASEGANNLFDGNTDTKWCFAFSNSAYVIFQASKPGIVRGYTITTGADSGRETGRNPKGWTLYGSNDEYSDNGQQTWTVIDQVSNDSKLEDKSSTPYSYTCSSYSKKEKYKYFKWEITQGGSTLQMSEFKLDLDTKFCTTHKIVKVEAKAPTCTEVGNEEYWKCTECGHAFKDEQGTDEYTDQSYVIAAKGHQVEGATCKVCGITIFKYTVNNGEVTINGFTDGCFVSDLVIPDEIEECPVVAISPEAFKGAALTSVVIPASVQYIYYDAFRVCSSLSSVTFAEDGNLKQLGSKSFYGTALTNVTIPASVESIKIRAFEVESLQTVTFRRVAMGDNIESYGGLMFGNVSPTIYVPSGFEESYKKQLPSYADKIQGQEVTSMVFGGLRYTVNEAHDGMVCQGFADDAQAGDQDASTTDLTIPAMVGGCPVTGIAANAFTGKALGSVSIPVSVATIGENTFGTISSITFARIPSAVVSIEGYADQFAQSVESIHVPAGCEDDYQQQLASHASSIQGQDIVSNGLRYKRNDAKDGLACNGLSSSESDSETLEVTIPAKVNDLFVTAISANAFKDNEKLNVVSFAEDTQVKVIGEGAFSGTGITSVVIPASVATIGANAFSACQNLASMRLLREAAGEDALAGYAANMLGEEPAGQVKIYVLNSYKDSYLAQLPNYQSRILGFFVTDDLLYLANEAGDGYVCAGFSEKNKGGTITIPAEVDGLPVTAIAERAFYKEINQEYFVFAEDSKVKVIGKEAFAVASSYSLVIPASVEVIEEGAFNKFNSSSITFSEGSQLTTIGKDAFANIALDLLEIPASVTKIGENAFGGNERLTLALLREAFSADDLAGYDQSMLGNDVKNTLMVYVPKQNAGIYKTSLSSISSRIYAFVEVDGLYYRENAARNGWICVGFSGEKKDDVVIPEKVEGLPVKAIDCRDVYIDHYAFKDISSVVVPASVESVSGCAFDDVSKLYLKRIPVADAGIGGYAFYGNQYAAFTIYVPRGCEDAYKAQLPKLAVAITGEDIIANNLKFMLTLDKDGLFCLGSTDLKLTELTIPASVQGCPVTDILTDAFARMDCLEKVRLMADNVYIGDNAFLGASKLKYILVNSDEAAAKYRQMSFQRHELVVSHVEEAAEVSLTDETGFSPAHRFTYYQEGSLSYHRTFGESGQYATICLPFDVNLEEASGTFEKVYVPMGNMIHRVEETSTEAGASGSKELFILMLDKKEQDAHIPAATPFFVKLAEGKSEVTFKHRNSLIWDKDEADKWKDMKVYDWDGHTGLMEQNTSFQFSYGGNYEPKDASQEQNLWTFNTDGSFGPQTTGTLAPFRLFLRVSKDDGFTSEPGNADSPSIQAREYVITIGVSDGTATGISEIISSEKLGSDSSHASSASLRGNIYDLSGRKVGTTADTDVKKLGKGIYVVNGKKMVVK